MKIYFTSFLIIYLFFNLTLAQVSIGLTQPDASSELDVNSNSRGILIPRMTEAQRLAITSPSEGLLVYQTNLTSGFWYYNSASTWVNIQTSSGWNITGNTGVLATDFLGTQDANGIRFITNNFSITTGNDAVYLDEILISEFTDVLRIQDGNEAVGYVMVSDAAGNATWSDPSSFSSADEDWAFTSGSTNTDPIHRTGNVLIGTTGTPGYNLHIYNGLADGTQIGLGSTEFITDRLSEFAISDDIVPEVDNSISIGSLANRWSQVYAVNGIILTSDENLKENIQPLQYGIKELLEIETVHYQWKKEQYGETIAKPKEKLKKIGFLAQQLKTVLPEVVEDQTWKLQDNNSYKRVVLVKPKVFITMKQYQ